MSDSLIPEAMEFHGPGWNIEANGYLFQIWAPRPNRALWAACWTDLSSDYEAEFRRFATPADALSHFQRWPDVAKAFQNVAVGSQV